MNLISLVTMLFISAVIITFGLVYSHRIAGPLYRLQKYLKGKNEDKEKGPLHFRQNDYFPELADSVNEFIAGHAKKTKTKKVA